MLQKANKKDAVVEFVMSGSRMKLFIPKDSLMLTFLLSGKYFKFNCYLRHKTINIFDVFYHNF